MDPQSNITDMARYRRTESVASRLRLVVIDEQTTERRRRPSPHGWQVLGAEYWPIIMLAVLRTTARIRQWRRQRRKNTRR
jgi:hypothetical protein